jgi:hypothetical protein
MEMIAGAVMNYLQIPPKPIHVPTPALDGRMMHVSCRNRPD